VAVDFVYRIEEAHERGQLARLCSAVAEGGGLINEVKTISIGRERSIREINVEVSDPDAAERLASDLGEVDGVRVLSCVDRALSRHEGGKLVVNPCIEVESLQDMRDVYTPGVARVCRAIEDDPALARRLTMVGRTVAICTNGTRVLGLGDIGPLAAMPVMEGKAVFYCSLVGISAVPILIDTDDPDEFVETVLRIAPGFGAIHLEDIRVPDCFEIERRLIDALDVPVMHDDVHGTAVVTLAAIEVATRQVGIELGDATVGQIGLGAAGYGIASLVKEAGAKKVIASEPNEDAHARASEREIELGSLTDVMEQAEIVVATSGQPDLIEPKMVREGQVILALTNPDPEIEPSAALDAGAAFAADGTSVNNVLGYPGLFRGALAAGAREISTAMKLAAAHAIAELTEASELVPEALDQRVHEHVAEAVAEAAEKDGIARRDHVPAGL
jgi:malate dehydrogenase (oxaloacetate-decarboxylating)